jgi:hypothetical protein
VTVSTPVTALTANTTYHFRVIATNIGGTSQGGDQTFKTLPNPPTVTTGAASSITQTTTTLNASVNPNSAEVTECKLEYWTTVVYESSAPCNPPPGSGDSPVDVSALLTALAADTTYHYRVVASNAGGTSAGPAETFTTQLPTTLEQQLPGQKPTTLEQQLSGQQPTSQGQASSTSASQVVSAFQDRTTPAVPDADLASTSLRESATGAVNVTVRCPADESSCTGTVTLRAVVIASATATRRSKNSKATILTLATASFTVAGGKLTTMRLHLSSAARALLAHTHLLYARATIFARDLVGATHTAQTPVTIRAYRRSGGRTA